MSLKLRAKCFVPETLQRVRALDFGNDAKKELKQSCHADKTNAALLVKTLFNKCSKYAWKTKKQEREDLSLGITYKEIDLIVFYV